MIHKFRIYGTVRGQGRPRFRRFGKTYEDKKDTKWKENIKELYINSGGVHFGDKPIMIAAFIHRKLPDSKPKYIKSEMDTHTPDCDNVIKAISDALNEIAYNDDKQIIVEYIVKMPRVRQDGEYIDVIISDEINMSDMLMRVEGLFHG